MQRHVAHIQIATLREKTVVTHIPRVWRDFAVARACVPVRILEHANVRSKRVRVDPVRATAQVPARVHVRVDVAPLLVLSCFI